MFNPMCIISSIYSFLPFYAKKIGNTLKEDVPTKLQSELNSFDTALSL